MKKPARITPTDRLTGKLSPRQGHQSALNGLDHRHKHGNLNGGPYQYITIDATEANTLTLPVQSYLLDKAHHHDCPTVNASRSTLQRRTASKTTLPVQSHTLQMETS